MVAWRVARCLDQLLRQVNASAPHRSLDSDGSIGDASHQTRDSDHNPWVKANGLGIVTARDFTHDPAGGFDAYAFAEALKAANDVRVKYVISQRRIWSRARNSEGWRPYTGSNPHTKHTHVSCTASYPLFDNTAPWRITTTPSPEADWLDMATKAEVQAAFEAAIENKGPAAVEAGVGAYMARFMKDEAGTGDTLRDEAAERGQAIVAAIEALPAAFAAAITKRVS